MQLGMRGKVLKLTGISRLSIRMEDKMYLQLIAQVIYVLPLLHLRLNRPHQSGDKTTEVWFTTRMRNARAHHFYFVLNVKYPDRF
jgi:hypothetical protein